jgi:saccharopine dehydrogenase (NAD+, L-lysine-forming)
VAPEEVNVLVVAGATGQVGRAATAALAARHPGQVEIWGRDPRKVEALARELGVRGRVVDLREVPDEALRGVRAVLMCSEAGGVQLAARCLAAGVDYVDVTAEQRLIEAIEQQQDVARAAGSRAVLHVGLAPGVTNLLGHRAHLAVGGADKLDLFVVLGLGEAHGPAAIEWTLAHFEPPFTVLEGGQPREVRPLRESAIFQLPDERPRRGWRFDFPDQRALARDLGIPTCSTWLAFDSRLVTAGAALAARLGLLGLLRWPALHGLAVGSDRFVVLAVAEGPRGRAHFWVEGHGEGEMTGRVAAETVSQLLERPIEPGVHGLHAVLTLEDLAQTIRYRSHSLSRRT